MDTQTSPTSMILFVLEDNLPAQPIQACSRDYGFDFDEEEIGRKMLAPLPFKTSSHAIPEVDADEFEQVFQCFLS